MSEPEARVAEPPKSSLLDVKSPMVGTFYGAPEPGAKLVMPGAVVAITV